MIKFYDFLLTILTPIIKFIGLFGLPPRKITGVTYYQQRDNIEVGTVLLTKTYYELSNLINPTELKHGGIFIGDFWGIPTVLEATTKGVKVTNLVSFLYDKDELVICKPKFLREGFYHIAQKSARQYFNLPYDYLFNKDAKAFYCFELIGKVFNDAYPELRFKCREIVKGKRIFDHNSFLDNDFFDVVFDSRKGEKNERC